LIVDAMNVIGSRPTGWWRDRRAAIRRFAGRLQALADSGSEEITMVVDGRPLLDLPEGLNAAVQVLYARRRGPNAADDRIVELVREHPLPKSLVVVTSDAALAQRVRELGCQVRGASWLLERLDRLDA
jgi:predicted RNA-binding protein with PIN domain